MDAWRNPGRRWLWISGLAVMVVLVAIDTVIHLRTTYAVTAQHLFTAPAPDNSSPTGYALGQRDIILPYVGMDGYHWIMQTQQMFADGNPRVRFVDYDNYDNGPKGREVHWSSSFRWWVALLAWLEHAYGAVPLPYAVEDVMPFANTILIVLLILGVTPTLARRLGAGPAAVVAMGMVAVGPLYEAFSEGKSDHHGLAALSGLLTLLFLIGGGAGWVKSENGAGECANPALRAWLPDRALARRWFIASAIAGGIGLWVSTASEAPVLAEVGLGALLATGLLGRGASKSDLATSDPTLWRVWGVAGATTSLFFYLLEYFPSHFGLRLEVNHPLYALAWAGGGELLCRLSRWWSGDPLAVKSTDWLVLALSALAVAIVPLMVLLYASQVFWVADRFLFIFHEDYIAEFKSLGTYLASMYAGGSRFYLPAVANPLFLLAVPMVAWCWRDLRPLVLILACAWVIGYPLYDCWIWHQTGVLPFNTQFGWLEFGAVAIAVVLILRWPPWYLLALALVIYATFLSDQSIDQLNNYFWPAIAVPVIVLLALLALWKPWEEFPRPAKALLLLGLPPGLATLALSTREMRWMEIGYALWLAALAGTIVALALSPGYRWTWSRRLAAWTFLAAVFVPGPSLMVYGWIQYGWKAPMSDVEIMESITRDVSQRLRARLGSDPGVVVSGPTTTTWMIYWGGFKGLGTLYWENLAGLKNTMDIYAAPSPDAALKLIQARGVTHIAIYSWDPFYKEYARLAHGWHKPATEAETEAEKPKLRNAFMYNVVEGHQIPKWLRPVYYPMPPDKMLRGQSVLIFEVAPEQTVEESNVRVAQWQLAMGSPANAYESLRNALQIHPNYLPALICAARVDQALGRQDEFTVIMQAIRQLLPEADSLELEERIDLAVLLVMTNDSEDATREIAACVRQADARSLRRTGLDQLYRFLVLARQINLLNARPGLTPFILTLLPETTRLQYQLDCAHYEAAQQHWPAELGLLRQAAARFPNEVYALNSLARFLATTPDADLRNGREAVALTLQALALDKSQHPEITDTLACAYAEAGQFGLAQAAEQQAIAGAEAAKLTSLAEQCQLHLGLFRSNQSYHDPTN
jgi:hypothetical protein